MTTQKRERLPQRRGGENLEFQCERPGVPPIQYNATVGYHADGRLAEIFLRASKSGTDLNIQAQETAIAVSMALQWGCPAETIRAAMPRTNDKKPEGAIGTLLDLLAEEGKP